MSSEITNNDGIKPLNFKQPSKAAKFGAAIKRALSLRKKKKSREDLNNLSSVEKVDLQNLNKHIQQVKPVRWYDYFLRPRTAFKHWLRTQLYQPQSRRLTQKGLDFLIGKLRREGMNVEICMNKSSNGLIVPSLFARNPEAKNNQTKVYFHGNQGHFGALSDQAIEDYKRGYNVCLATYRSYIGRMGILTQQGIIDDASAAIDTLIDKKAIPSSSIDIEAHSLGSAVAINTLAQRNLRKQSEGSFEKFNNLTLIAPFNSIQDMIKEKLWFLPKFLIKWLFPDAWNNEKTVKDICTNSIHIVHGSADRIVPISQGAKLHKAVRENHIPSSFAQLQDVNHHDITKYRNSDIYESQHRPHELPLPYEADDHFIHISDRKTHNPCNGYEHAVDILMPIGTPVKAIKDGEVISVIDQHKDSKADEISNDAKKTNEILVKCHDGTLVQYAQVQHGSSKVKVGQQIKTGEHIANSGHNGISETPHIHLTIGYKDSKQTLKLNSRPIIFDIAA